MFGGQFIGVEEYVIVNTDCQMNRLQNCLRDKTSSPAIKKVYRFIFTEMGRPTLNVGSTTAWAGGWDQMKTKNQTEHKQSFSA